MANNVIDFNAKLIDKKLDEYYEAEQQEYDEYTETLNYIYDDLLDSLRDCGVANDSDGFVKDFAYVMEAVRSLVNRQFEEYHNFHAIVDKSLEILRDEDGYPTDVIWKPKLTPKEE